MDLMRNASLSQAVRDSFVALVDNIVSGTNAPSGWGGQKVLHLQNYFTAPELKQLCAADVGQGHTLFVIAERCNRLGAVRPTEKSVASMLAPLFVDGVGVARAGPSVLQALREFKSILHREKGTTRPTSAEFPEFPRLLQTHHAHLYRGNYANAPPLSITQVS